MCTGAPCTRGKRAVICTASMAAAGFMGRMETTKGPWNTPTAWVGTWVLNMGTFLPCCTCRKGMPASIKALSKENEQPITKLTQSSCQRCRMSGTSSLNTPSRHTRYMGRSERMSMSSPKSGKAKSPGAAMPNTGQGLGLSSQKRAKSSAWALGKMTKLPCTWSPAKPEVWPRSTPMRACWRMDLAWGRAAVMGWALFVERVCLGRYLAGI